MADTINLYLLLIGTFLAAIWMGATAYKDRHNKLTALITSAFLAMMFGSVFDQHCCILS
jgi:hypothetical protein